MSKRKTGKSGPKSLSELRAGIDSIDRKILDLINGRASLALEVMEAKKSLSRKVYDPEREREIEEKISDFNRGPLSDGGAVAVFREIIRACRNIQSGARVSYLGPEGSFSHQAAAAIFGGSAELVPLRNLEEVFGAVADGSVSKGVVPIENSTEGSVARVLEIMADSDVRITGEHFENVNHFLLSKTGKTGGIKKVASHPQALGQCGKWISSNLPDAEQVEASSTAAAAAMAAADPSVAAIAAAYSASIYGLRAAAENIEDNPLNATRFVTVEKADGSSAAAEGNKVSIVFSLRDEPGALNRALFSPLAAAGVNLTRIESRPSGKRPWEYMFFADFEGSVGRSGTDGLIEKIRGASSRLKVLGCYFSGR